MKCIDFQKLIVASFHREDAVDIERGWSLFAYIGDTEYHIHFYHNGEEKGRISNSDLMTLYLEAVKWYYKGSRTTIPPTLPWAA